MKRKLGVLGMCTFAALVSGVLFVSSEALGRRPCGPMYCLDVWNPVICSNGVVYSNSCYAARACATGCVPYGGDDR